MKKVLTGFDPRRSNIAPSTLADFLKNDINEDITSVPGIGPAAAKSLAMVNPNLPGDYPVETTFQLIGKFLSLREKGMKPADHANAMWIWLQNKGIIAYRSGIVLAIAEKVNTMIPGIYYEG